jgi:hypothetical protein
VLLVPPLKPIRRRDRKGTRNEQWGSAVKLDPAQYTCPEHHTDLTGQVLDALDVEGPPLVYERPLPGRPARPRPFEVPVTCPGASGGSPHELTCTGTYTK